MSITLAFKKSKAPRKLRKLYLNLQIQKDDLVLELGCSYGVCTHILAQHAQEVRGVDNSHQLIAEVRLGGKSLKVYDILMGPEWQVQLQGVAWMLSLPLPQHSDVCHSMSHY